MSQARCYVLYAGIILLAGCSGPPPKAPAEVGPGPTENRTLFDAVHKADQLVLYEGLPHPADKQLFDEEKAKKANVTLHGFAFYREPLEISATDKEQLRGLLADKGSFQPWRGEKKCGGFHPDYLAAWRTGEVTYRFLICFGCHEVKVYGDGTDVRWDIRSEAYGKLLEVLEPYRKNRPADERH